MDIACIIQSPPSIAGLNSTTPSLSLFRLKGVRRGTVEMSGVQPGDRVLDICTGTGDVALVTGVVGGLYPA